VQWAAKGAVSGLAGHLRMPWWLHRSATARRR